MCIVFFVFGHPKYKLILASNRDESLKRPTQAADYWDIDSNIISGIDLATVTHINKPNKDLNNKKSTKLKRGSLPSDINYYEKQLLEEILKKNENNIYHSSLPDSVNIDDNINKYFEKHKSINNIYKTEKQINGYGTWLGCTSHGLFSTLTNFREDPKHLLPNAISRGYLVRDFLLLKSLYYKSKNRPIPPSSQINTKLPIQNNNNDNDSNKNHDKDKSHQKVRMHHPIYQAPEKVLKRYEEEDKLYAMEDTNNNSNNCNNNDDDNNNDLIDFPYEYMKYVNKNKDKYNGFNLIVGDVSLPEPSVWYIGNKDDSSTEKLKKNTVYGISNGSLNTYWKKIERGKKLFAKAVDNHSDLNDLVHKLLNVLSDKKDVPMEKLPKTAFEPKLEKCCAPICIEKERFNGTIFENDYATRTHTVIVIDNDNHVTYVEQDQYDTLSNNYILKQQCYVFPSNSNTNTNVNNKNTEDSLNLMNATTNTTATTTTINLTSSSTTNLHQYANHNINYSPKSRTMTMPINIPRQRKHSFDSSFPRSYTTSFTTDLPYYISPSINHYSFDNIYYAINNINNNNNNKNKNNINNNKILNNSYNYNNTKSNTSISFSSIESITGDTLLATTLSTSNSSFRNNYFFNSPFTSNSSIISPTYNNNNVLSDLYNSSIYTENTLINDSSIKNQDQDEDNNQYEEDQVHELDYIEDELEKMSMESPNSSLSSSPIKSFSNHPVNTLERMPSLSSCTPISPSVFNFFESINSYDYKEKPIESQFVKRNVHDLSKANIHQFKLNV